MTNYICINGKKAELTEEQMKALGIELPKASPFERAKKGTKYFSIVQDGTVDWHYENMDAFDKEYFNAANYCTDESLMEQRALYEILNRLLWRYSMEHDGDKIKENCYGGIKCRNGVFESFTAYGHSVGRVQFYDEQIAENAIEQIIKPFMEAHPEFKF